MYIYMYVYIYIYIYIYILTLIVLFYVTCSAKYCMLRCSSYAASIQ